jgi:hypothetical protein
MTPRTARLRAAGCWIAQGKIQGGGGGYGSGGGGTPRPGWAYKLYIGL